MIFVYIYLWPSVLNISTDSRVLSTTSVIPWGSVKVGELLMLWAAVSTRDLRSSESEGLHCHHQQQPRCQIFNDHNQPRRFPAVLLGQVRTLSECSTWRRLVAAFPHLVGGSWLWGQGDWRDRTSIPLQVLTTILFVACSGPVLQQA